MKKFFLTIIPGLLIGLIVLVSVSCYDIFVLSRRIDYTVDPQCHTICIGPSTVQTSIDDSLLVGVKNLGRSGNSYIILTPVLEQILEYNPHIDTVFIGHGPFMAYTYPNSGPNNTALNQMRDNIHLFFHLPECRKHFLNNKNFYALFVNPNLMHLRHTNEKTLHDLAFNQMKDRPVVNGLYKDSKDWSIHWYDSVHYGEFNKYTCQYIEENYSINLSEIDRAIALCHEHNAVPILLFTPLYQIDRWIDRQGFREYLDKHYDHSILVADYTDFQFPNTDYYQDVHHLNIHGAAYLTNHIAQEGWHLQTLEEWLMSKRD